MYARLKEESYSVHRYHTTAPKQTCKVQVIVKQHRSPSVLF